MSRDFLALLGIIPAVCLGVAAGLATEKYWVGYLTTLGLYTFFWWLHELLD